MKSTVTGTRGHDCATAELLGTPDADEPPDTSYEELPNCRH